MIELLIGIGALAIMVMGLIVYVHERQRFVSTDEKLMRWMQQFHNAYYGFYEKNRRYAGTAGPDVIPELVSGGYLSPDVPVGVDVVVLSVGNAGNQQEHRYLRLVTQSNPEAILASIPWELIRARYSVTYTAAPQDANDMLAQPDPVIPVGVARHAPGATAWIFLPPSDCILEIPQNLQIQKTRIDWMTLMATWDAVPDAEDYTVMVMNRSYPMNEEQIAAWRFTSPQPWVYIGRGGAGGLSAPDGTPMPGTQGGLTIPERDDGSERTMLGYAYAYDVFVAANKRNCASPHSAATPLQTCPRPPRDLIWKVRTIPPSQDIPPEWGWMTTQRDLYLEWDDVQGEQEYRIWVSYSPNVSKSSYDLYKTFSANTTTSTAGNPTYWTRNMGVSYATMTAVGAVPASDGSECESQMTRDRYGAPSGSPFNTRPYFEVGPTSVRFSGTVRWTQEAQETSRRRRRPKIWVCSYTATPSGGSEQVVTITNNSGQGLQYTVTTSGGCGVTLPAGNPTYVTIPNGYGGTGTFRVKGPPSGGMTDGEASPGNGPPPYCGCNATVDVKVQGLTYSITVGY